LNWRGRRSRARALEQQRAFSEPVYGQEPFVLAEASGPDTSLAASRGIGNQSERPMAAYEAGQKLIATGAADSNDPNMQRLLAQLNSKGWLDKHEAGDAASERNGNGY